MWFKNLQIYRLRSPANLTAAQLEQSLEAHQFQPCSSIESSSHGWMPPRPNSGLVHTVGKQLLISLGTEKKLLPASVINQVTKARAIELEEQQGYRPGRKQMKDLKEQVADDLPPRAFSISGNVRVWIDPVGGWLIIDAASAAKAEPVIKLLLKSIDKLALEGLRTQHSPVGAMTGWLAADEAPGGFTIDQDTELRSTGESKATVRYVRHTLEADDVRRHIEAGKQCTRLAMTWNDRISFVLTDSLVLKRIAPLDVLKENEDAMAQNDDERFDGDFMLMAGELARLLPALVESLGGEMQTGREERKAA